MLHFAARMGDLKILEILLSKELDVDAPNKTKETPLVYYIIIN